MDVELAVLTFLVVGLVLVNFLPTKGWAATRLAPSLMSILVLGVCSLLLLAEFREGWIPLVALAMAAAAIGSLIGVVVVIYRHLRQARRTSTVRD